MTNLEAIAKMEFALAHSAIFKKDFRDYIEIIVTEELGFLDLKSLNKIRTKISERVIDLFDSDRWVRQGLK